MGCICSVVDTYDRRCERFLAAVARGDLHGATAELTGPAMLQLRSAAGRTALEIATMRQDEPMVEFLLQRGADPDCGRDVDSDPVFMASFCGWTYALRLMLRTRPHLANKARTRSMLSSRDGSPRLVSFLPVHLLAASRRPLEALEVLLEARAAICAADSRGNTALHHAARATPLCLRFFEALLREFVRRGASLDAPNHAGQPALECALRAGNLRAAAALLRCGASMHALRSPSTRVLRLLLAAAPDRQAALAYVSQLHDLHSLYKND